MDGPSLSVILLAGFLILFSISPVGGQGDDNEDERFKSNDGDFECFYDVGTHNDLRYLGAIYCKYGCCGRTDDQKCCTEEEKNQKEHRLSGTMVILATTFGSVVAIIITSIVLYCCCKHKVEKHKEKHKANYAADIEKPHRGDVFTVMEMGPREPREPVPSGSGSYPWENRTPETPVSAPPDRVTYPQDNSRTTQEGGDASPQYGRSDQMVQPPTYSE